MAWRALSIALPLCFWAMAGVAAEGATPHRMATEDVLACWNKLHLLSHLYLTGKPPTADLAMTAKHVEDNRPFVDSDVHHEFCRIAPTFYHQRIMGAKKNDEAESLRAKAQREYQEEDRRLSEEEEVEEEVIPFKSLAVDAVSRIPAQELEQHKRRYLHNLRRVQRRLQAVTFRGEFDPLRLEFTEASTLIGKSVVKVLGNLVTGGYDVFSQGASDIQVCVKFDEVDANGDQTVKGGCKAEAVSIFMLVYFTLATVRAYLYEFEFGPALAVINSLWIINETWKDSIDFTGAAYGSVRIYELFVNLKNILNNDKLTDEYLAAIASGMGGLAIQSTDIINDIDNAHKNISNRFPAIDAQITNIENETLAAYNANLNAIQTALTTQYARVVNKIRNVEERVIDAVTNAFLDKLTIGGTNRPGRLVPPPPAARRKLFEAWTESKKIHDEMMETAAADDSNMAGAGHRKLQFIMSQYLYGYGCDGIDNDQNGQVDEIGEDKFGPIIDTDALLDGVNGQWFSAPQDLFTAVNGLVVGEDDCGAVSFSQPTLQGKCKNATVSVTAIDSTNNQATASVPVWFDNKAPSVSFKLMPDPRQLFSASPPFFKATGFYVDVGIAQLVIDDDCDTKPFVQINVYCDELDAGPFSKYQQAFIVRQYDSKNNLVGWKIRVRATVGLSCKDSTVCLQPDGRVYSVIICVKDQAGNKRCSKRTIGVSKYMDKNPVAQGELFHIAHDAAFLNVSPADLEGSVDATSISY